MDEEKRIPLSNKEYYSLRNVFGIVNILDECLPMLRKRLELIDAQADMELVQARFERVMAQILRTIPPNKLVTMRKDLNHMTCEVRIAYDYAKRDNREFTYCPTEAIDRLAKRVLDWECLSCDKCAKEAKKCPVFKDINDCYPWELPPNGDMCPLAGVMETSD